MEKQIENFENLLEERKILQNQNVMPVKRYPQSSSVDV